MADAVEPIYRLSDSEQVARLWPYRECEANIMLDNSDVRVALVAAVGLIRTRAGQRHSFLLFMQKSEKSTWGVG